MSPDLERKLYYDGIQLFNEREFFEAHEVWEDAWHMAYGLKHSFIKASSNAPSPWSITADPIPAECIRCIKPTAPSSPMCRMCLWDWT